MPWIALPKFELYYPRTASPWFFILLSFGLLTIWGKKFVCFCIQTPFLFVRNLKQYLKFKCLQNMTLRSLIPIILISCLPLSAQFTTHSATWNSFNSTDWNTAANWFPAVVPDNQGFDLYNVFIEGQPAATSTVQLSTSIVIDKLDIDNGDSLIINPLASLSFTEKSDVGTLDNIGLIFSENRDSQIRGGAIINRSSLEARANSFFKLHEFDGPLTIDQSNGGANTGIIMAKGAGASLELDLTSVTQGQIRAEDSATVDIQNGFFDRVTFATHNGGTFDNLRLPLGDVTFKESVITEGTEVELGGFLDLANHLDNDGILHFDGNSRVDLSADDNSFNFDGSGTFTQKNSSTTSVQLAGNLVPDSSIVIAEQFTFNGSVVIGGYNSFITNHGTISCDGLQSGHLYPGGTTSTTITDRYPVLRNSGLIEANVPGRFFRFHADRDDVSYLNSGIIRSYNQGLIELSTGNEHEVSLLNGMPFNESSEDGIIDIDGTGSEIRLFNASRITGGHVQISNSGTLTMNDNSSLYFISTSTANGTGNIEVRGGTGTDAVLFGDVTNGSGVEIEVGLDRDLQIAPPDPFGISGRFENDGFVRLRRSKLHVGDQSSLGGTGTIQFDASCQLTSHSDGEAFTVKDPLSLDFKGGTTQLGRLRSVITNEGNIFCTNGTMVVHPFETGIGMNNSGEITSSGLSSEAWFRAGTYRNTGLIESDLGGKLSLTTKESGLAGSKPTFLNENGQIRADGPDSTIDILETKIQDGTLTVRDSATGLVKGDDVTLDSVTINVDSNAVLTFENGVLFPPRVEDCTLNISSSGEGNVDAGAFTKLRASVSNTDSMLTLNDSDVDLSTLTLTDNGVLEIGSGTALTDSIIKATDSTTSTFLRLGSAKDCTLDTGNGKITYLRTSLTDVIVTGNGTLLIDDPSAHGNIDGLSLGSDATIELRSGCFFNASNTFNIDGTITANGTLNSFSGIEVDTSLTLIGSGVYTMSGADAFISGKLSGETLNIGPSFTIQGSGIFGGSGTELDLLNQGTISLNNPAISTSFILSASLSNGGTLELANNCAASVDQNFENNAILKMNPASTLNISGSLINAGFTTMANSSICNTTQGCTNSESMTLNATSKLNLGTNYTQTLGTTTLNGTISAPGGINLNGGTLVGGGIIDGDFSAGAATIAPGFPLGTLTATSATAFTPNTILAVELNGTSPGSQHDQFQVSTGSLNLGGAGLSITLSPAYLPLPSDVFTIATSQLPITGTIGNLTNGRLATVANKGSFAVNIVGNSLQLSDFQIEIPDIEDLDLDLLDDDWERTHFGGIQSQGALDDPDGDGISNLFEFALGTDPKAPGTLPFGITISDHEGVPHLFVTYQRRVGLQGFLSISIESSGALQIFTRNSISFQLHSLEASALDPELETLKFRSTLPYTNLPTPGFTRLTVGQ